MLHRAKAGTTLWWNSITGFIYTSFLFLLINIDRQCSHSVWMSGGKTESEGKACHLKKRSPAAFTVLQKKPKNLEILSYVFLLWWWWHRSKDSSTSCELFQHIKWDSIACEAEAKITQQITSNSFGRRNLVQPRKLFFFCCDCLYFPCVHCQQSQQWQQENTKRNTADQGYSLCLFSGGGLTRCDIMLWPICLWQLEEAVACTAFS